MDIPIVSDFRRPYIDVDMEFFRDIITSDMKWAMCAIATHIGLFGIIDDSGMTVSEIAKRLGAEELPMKMLLDFLSGFRIIRKEKDRYYATSFSKMKRLFGPYYGEESVQFNPFWSRFIRILRGEKLKPLQPIHRWWSPEEQRRFIVLAICGEFQRTLELLERENVFGGAKKMLDIGGGHGLYSIGFCSIYPELRSTIFDLPGVVDLAVENIRRYGMEDRVEVLVGNALVDDYPSGYDVAFMSDVTFKMSDAKIVVEKTYECLRRGGRFVIKDIVPCNDWGEAPYALSHEISQLIIAGSVEEYGEPPPTMREYTEIMRNVGFRDTKILGEITRGWTSLIVGYK